MGKKDKRYAYSDFPPSRSLYIQTDGLMNALFTDDIVLDSLTGCLTLSGKFEDALNEKIRENEDVLVIHGTLGEYNINKYPWCMIGSNNWRKFHGMRMRRRKWLRY